MTRSFKSRWWHETWRRAWPLVSCAGALLATVGCYERVVKDSGMGRDGEQIYEPNLPDKPSVVDQVLWGVGDPPQSKRKKN